MATQKSRRGRRGRRALRWLRNILIGIVGFVALLLAAAYLVFETRWGKDMLKDQIESRMADSFIGGASIGGLDGNPLRELVLKDVVINGPDGQPAITVARLTIELPLIPLISQQLRVDTLIAEDLDVYIEKDARGRLNVANLTKPGPKSQWSIELPNVEVHRGHVRLELEPGGEPIDIDNIELYVDAALPFAGPIDATASLSADWRQREAPIDLAATIHIDDEVTAVRSLAAQVSDIDVFATGVTLPKGVFSKPIGGTISVYAPAETVRALVPQVDLPGDVALAATARPEGRITHVAATVSVGAGHIRVLADADVQAKLVDGLVEARANELAGLTGGALDGAGGAVAAFELDGNDQAELPTVRAMVTAWLDAGKAPATHAVIALHSAGERVHATVGASSDTGLQATLDAAIRKRGERITLERGTLVASTDDARRATQGLAPFRGSLSANLAADGALAPAMDLSIRGHADGKRIRVQDFAADSFRFRIAARNVPDKPIGSARLELSDLRRGDLRLGKLTIAAGNRPDGKIQVSLRSVPKPAPWRIDLDALVTPGDTVVVDLQRHLVRAAGGTVWRGDTGTVTIGPREVELRDFASRSGRGQIAAEATFVRAGRNTGDLAAQVDASFELSDLEKLYRGKAEAHIDVSRVNGRLSGSVRATGRGISLDPKQPIVFDGDATITATTDVVTANVNVGSSKTGRACLALDVDAPKDITDARAWSRLGRDAIRTASVTLDDVNLDGVAKVAGAQPMKGQVDGTLALTPTSATGAIRVRGVQTRQTKDLGDIVADITVAEPAPNELRATVTARLKPLPAALAARDITQDGAARFHADARFEVPERLFDMTAWKRLGADAFRGGSLRAERLAFHPGTLERLGIVSDLRGELAVGAELDAGMEAARFSVNLHQLRGGMFAKPIAATVSGVLDETSSRVIASVYAQNITLLKVSSSIPVTLDELRANPGAARTAPLRAIGTIAHVPAVTLLGVLGTSQITGGTLDGTIQVAGTLARPTLDANLVARDVSVPPEGDKPTPMLKLLRIDAGWDGARGRVAIDASQTDGGWMRLRARGSPSELASVTATLDANKVDIAPLVAFMPGPAGGLGGRLDAKFTVRGADPATADIAGSLHITNGRIPIAPAVGTLFKGDVKLDVRNDTAALRVTGSLGRGEVELVAKAPLDGATPRSGELRLTVRKVQLIGTTEPVITGVVKADVARVDEVWRANVRVDDMDVKIPSDKGQKLAPVGAPSDLVYGGEKIHHGKKKGRDAPAGIIEDEEGPVDFKAPAQVAGPVPKRRAPTDPIVDVKLVLRDVFVESNEVRGVVGGNLRVKVAENNEVGVIGFLTLSRGVVDLFNRRYQVDKANLHFDGSPDPVLDVRIMHDFPEVTTITEVRGRMSDPELVLSAEPAQYTQAELLGFLLGGEPSGDPENAPSASERVASAGASFLGNKVSGYVKEALPVDIDVLRYEAASSTSSAAVTVGTWITDTLFLAYRRHLEARPDENTGEAEIEYWIQRRLVLEGVLGNRGINGLDLLWRRRW